MEVFHLNTAQQLRFLDVISISTASTEEIVFVTSISPSSWFTDGKDLLHVTMISYQESSRRHIYSRSQTLSFLWCDSNIHSDHLIFRTRVCFCVTIKLTNCPGHIFKVTKLTIKEQRRTRIDDQENGSPRELSIM